jgi:dipeptidyl aminopeptidase/acylaminoacyl peptidase
VDDYESYDAVAFSPDGTRLAAMNSSEHSADNSVHIWNTATGEEIAVLRGHERWSRSVAFDPTGERLASGGWDRTIRIWDADTGECLLILRGHGDAITSLAFSPDGTRVVSGSHDETVRIWDVLTGEELLLIRGRKGSSWPMVVFSPDGRRLASGSYDKTVLIWDPSTGEELLVLRHQDGVSAVTFSPDGTRLASASMNDNVIRIWDVSAGREVAALHGHEDVILSLAFSPDGTRLASASRDITARIWDPKTGEHLRVLRGHQAGLTSVAFGPDGMRLASASWDGTVRIWHTEALRIRHRRRRETLAARLTAASTVEPLWKQPIGVKSIAGQLRADVSLTDVQLQASLDLLLRRSARLQERVNDLFARMVFTEDVVAALEADGSMAPGTRHKAVTRALEIGDEGMRINRDSWNLVCSPSGDPESYEIGLRGAEVAVASDPNNFVFLGTLGMAQYRNRLNDEACATFTRCDQLRRQHGYKSVPRDVAGLTMALYRLGRVTEARLSFRGLEDMMRDPEEGWTYTEDERALFQECKQQLRRADALTEPLDETEDDFR